MAYHRRSNVGGGNWIRNRSEINLFPIVLQGSFLSADSRARQQRERRQGSQNHSSDQGAAKLLSTIVVHFFISPCFLISSFNPANGCCCSAFEWVLGSPKNVDLNSTLPPRRQIFCTI